MLRKLMGVLFSVVLVSAMASAGENANISGVLMDKMCSAETKTTAAALKHTKDCALMDDCVKSGYGVMTSDDKFYKFDAAGNQNARKLIKATDKAADWKVTVVGTVAGDTITVQSLTIDK